MWITFAEEKSKWEKLISSLLFMKQYLPLLGVFLLFFLVISGFAYGKPKKVNMASEAIVTAQTTALIR